MGTTRLGVFPSIHNKQNLNDLAFDICNFFIDKFPVGFFHHVYIDTQDSNANQFLVNDDGKFMQYESGQKITAPHIKFVIKQGRNNIDEAYNGFWNTNQQPGAFSIDTDLTGYKPILYDPYGIILATNDLPIRNTIDITIQINTKADQLSIMNILDSNIRRMYGYEVDVDSDIIIPNLLMEYIRSCVFRKEINILRKLEDSNDEKIKGMQEINKNFMEYLYKYSNKGIIPYKMKDRDDESDVVFSLKRKQRVYLKLEPYEIDEGNKKSNLYKTFNISISGTFDYANIISFITSVPSIVRGTKNPWFIRSSDNKDKMNYYHTIKFKEVFKDARKRAYVNMKKYSHFYLEKEILMASKTDTFNIIDDIIEKDESPSHYALIKALMSYVKTDSDFKSLFKVVIYKNNDVLDSSNYTIDKNFQFIVKNCDLSVPYYIDVFVNSSEYSSILNDIKSKLDDIGIDWKEPNEHTSYKGQTMFNIISNTSNIESVDNDYMIIKPILYLVPNTDYTYYIYINDSYKELSNLIEFKDNLAYYILDETSGKYTEIDTDSYLIPNKKYTYYTRTEDTSNNITYTKCSNLTAFDRNIDYYISNSDSGFGKIVSVSDNDI